MPHALINPGQTFMLICTTLPASSSDYYMIGYMIGHMIGYMLWAHRYGFEFTDLKLFMSLPPAPNR